MPKGEWMEHKKFLAFWGWKSLPWNEPVALDRLYWQERTQAICSRLLFSLSRTASLFVVSAPPGHGKSTLARWLYHRIDPIGHDVALFSLLHHESKSGWLLTRLGHYLGLDESRCQPRTIIQQLHEARLHGKVLTIMIDDAHKLTTPEAFDEILSLSHVQSIISSRVNFVLLGNPRLMQTLQQLDGIQHRLSLWTLLHPLNRNELASYLSHRLEWLQLPHKTLQSDALAVIAHHGIGTFANLDAVIEACLVEAFFRDQRSINADVMMTAMQFLGLQKATDEATGEATKTKAPSPRRRTPPASPSKPASPNAAMDLNSLYYKSGGGHDPEET
jgi:general secretion pathway protein A